MGKRKKILILILLLCLPLTMGAKLLDVELMGTDKNHPLVDLGALIKLGGDYVDGRAKESAKDPAKDSKETSEFNKSGTDKITPSKDKNAISVKVTNKTISINGMSVSEAKFEQAFKNIYKAGNPVELVDDYAEYYTFIELINIFNSLGVQYKMYSSE